MKTQEVILLFLTETGAMMEQPTVDPLRLTSDQAYQLLYVVYFWIQGVTYSIICIIGKLG